MVTSDEEERRLEYVLPLDDGGYLASIRDFGVARLSHEGANRRAVETDPHSAVTEAYPARL